MVDRTSNNSPASSVGYSERSPSANSERPLNGSPVKDGFEAPAKATKLSSPQTPKQREMPVDEKGFYTAVKNGDLSKVRYYLGSKRFNNNTLDSQRGIIAMARNNSIADGSGEGPDHEIRRLLDAVSPR